MSAVIVLDTTPLGILCHPRSPPLVQACRQWIADLKTAGRRVIVPEISDYELRRELIRTNNATAVSRLDGFGANLEFLPLNTAMMQLGAELWARARNAGKPTAPAHALDGDAILAAQALSLGVPVIVATSNPGHLAQFVATEDWQNIVP